MKRVLAALCLLLSPRCGAEAGAIPKPDPSSYNLCAGCHGLDGTGMKVGDLKLAPSLLESPIVKGDPEWFALVVLKGITKESDAHLEFMVPQELSLDDTQLATVLNFVRSEYGGKAAPVSVERIAAIRSKYKDMTDSITRAKLAELAKAKETPKATP